MEASAFLNLSLAGIAKSLVLFAIAIYIVFALVIVKQVRIMTDTLEIGFEKPLRFSSFVHLVFAIGVFLFALSTL